MKLIIYVFKLSSFSLSLNSYSIIKIDPADLKVVSRNLNI